MILMLWYIPCQRTIEWNAVCDIKSNYDIVYEVEVSDFLVNSEINWKASTYNAKVSNIWPLGFLPCVMKN